VVFFSRFRLFLVFWSSFWFGGLWVISANQFELISHERQVWWICPFLKKTLIWRTVWWFPAISMDGLNWSSRIPSWPPSLPLRKISLGFFYSSTLQIQDVVSELTHQLTPPHTKTHTHAPSAQARPTPIYEEVAHGWEVSEVIQASHVMGISPWPLWRIHVWGCPKNIGGKPWWKTWDEQGSNSRPAAPPLEAHADRAMARSQISLGLDLIWETLHLWQNVFRVQAVRVGWPLTSAKAPPCLCRPNNNTDYGRLQPVLGSVRGLGSLPEHDEASTRAQHLWPVSKLSEAQSSCQRQWWTRHADVLSCSSRRFRTGRALKPLHGDGAR
jgi:hypothetical protein